MKKIFVLLGVLLLLSGCAGNTSTESPAQAESSDTAAASQATAEPAVSVSDLDGSFTQISMPSANCGYALTGDARVWKTADGGKTWSEIDSISNAGQADVAAPVLCAPDDNTAYIAAECGGQTELYSTSDGGQTWSVSELEYTLDWEQDDIGGYFLSFPQPDTGYLLVDGTPAAGQMHKALYKTTDAGASWTMVTDPLSDGSTAGVGIGGYPSGMTFSTAENGWANCTSYGPYGAYFYETEDGGVTWTMVDPPQFPDSYAGLTEDDFYITAFAPSFSGSTGEGGKEILQYTRFTTDQMVEAYVYGSADDGTWKLEGQSDTVIVHYSFPDGGCGFGLDANGTLYQTNDGGLTWNEVN